jgi:HNH endonuclease
MDKKQEILQEILRVANAVSPALLTQQLFKQHSKIPISNLRYNFGSFNKAIAAAGLKPNVSGVPVSGYRQLSDKDLFAAIGELWSHNGTRPSDSLMNAEGKYSVRPYRARWGTFQKAVDAYVSKFGEPASSGVGVQQKSASPPGLQKPAVIPKIHKPKAGSRPRSKILYGGPLDFRGLRYAPVNEQGVVYLFGMVSKELGFLIESIRTDYPDCEGKRCLDKAGTQWEHVRIEFEMRSSNFLEHGHNSDNCDLIVCWTHDWDDCPVEVLELKTELQKLSH